MKKQIFALSISTALIASPLGSAMAYETERAKLTPEALEAAREGMRRTDVNFEKILEKVKAARKRLEIIRTSKETDPVLQLAEKYEFYLISFNAAAAATHTHNTRTAGAVMLASTLTTLLSSGVRAYKGMLDREGKMDSRALGKEISEAVISLRKSGLELDESTASQVSSGVEQIRNDLESVSAAINEANKLTPGEFRDQDVMQAAGAVLAVGSNLLHIIGPRLGLNVQREEGFIKKLTEFIKNLSSKGKQGSALGGSVSGMTDSYDLVFGNQSPQVAKILNDTYDNINKATLNLEKEIKNRKNRKNHRLKIPAEFLNE